MGCNCKKTYDKMEKYSDGYNPEYNDDSESLMYKILKIFSQILFGIFAGSIVIIIIIPMIAYLIVCLIIGKEPSFNLSKISKHKK